LKARPARLAPSSFDQSLFVEMAEALYAGHAIDLDADYDPAYAASDSQIEGESKDDDRSRPNGGPVTTLNHRPYDPKPKPQTPNPNPKPLKLFELEVPSNPTP
jgi:hypothetical protein